MIGSLNEAEDDDDENDSIIPGLGNEEVESTEFVDEFNVNVEYDVSGGSGLIIILIIIDLVLLYTIILDRSSSKNVN